MLAQVKLIAEPWDCGPGGYQVGGFPPGWAEWNDQFRDTVRAFWKGDEGKLADVAPRLCGSADLFNHRGRRPWACVNFVTAHDGFTLNDLVTYNDKHNEANGEDNKDGSSNNRSWNCGVEGPTDDPEINGLRERQIRNMLATLLLSQGTPMIAGRRRVRPHAEAATTTPIARTTRSAGSNWDIEEKGQTLIHFVQRVGRAPAQIPDPAPHPLPDRRMERGSASRTSPGSTQTAPR